MHNMAYYIYPFTPMDLQYQQCWMQAPMWLFVSRKLAAKLLATIQTTTASYCNISDGEENGSHIGYPIGYAN